MNEKCINRLHVEVGGKNVVCISSELDEGIEVDLMLTCIALSQTFLIAVSIIETALITNYLRGIFFIYHEDSIFIFLCTKFLSLCLVNSRFSVYPV